MAGIATGGIAVYYLVAMGLLAFGLHAPMIFETGIVGICFSLLVTAIAALNLFSDFALIESGAAQRAPNTWSDMALLLSSSLSSGYTWRCCACYLS